MEYEYILFDSIVVKEAWRIPPKIAISVREIKYLKDLILETILTASENMLKECWQVNTLSENKLQQWCELIASNVDPQNSFGLIHQLLYSIFHL